MIANLLVPVAPEQSCDTSFGQALEIADRLRARMVLVAAVAAPAEDLAVDMPGMEPNPVERAVAEEDFWPTEGGQPTAVPDFARAAAAQCAERRVAHMFLFAYGRLAPRLKDASRLCDLAVLPRPACPALTAREGLRLALGAGCPCLFAAGTPVQARKIVAWYDGDVASARSLRFACSLVADLNLTLTVLVSASRRTRADDLRHEAGAVASGYRIEREITAVVGLKPTEFAAAADDMAADVVAGPPLKPLVATALDHSSYMTLVAG